jgi:oligopeptidase B
MRLFLLCALSTVMSLVASDLKKAPVAKTAPHEMKLFGDTRNDPYFWMRDRKNPAVLEYVKAENAYTDAAFAPFEPLVDTVYKEILSHIKQTDLSPPYPDGGYLYYSRTVEGLQYPIFCRKKGSLDAPEEVLFDVNDLAKGHKFYSHQGPDPAPGHNLIGYEVDTTGYREYSFHVRNQSTGKELPDVIERVSGVEWAEDGKTVLYGRQHPQTKRSYQVWRHTLGTPASADVLVYEEKDERFEIAPGKTESGRFLTITAFSGSSSEVRYVDAAKPSDPFQVLIPRREGITYELTDHDGQFYILINDTSRDFRVVSAPIESPGQEHWREVIAARPGLYVEAIHAFRHHIVYGLRIDGLDALRVVDTRTGASHEIKFEEASYSAQIAVNKVYDTPVLRFSYTSVVTPQSVYDYNMDTRARTLVKQQEVPNYDASQYAAERVQVTSHDGTSVPMTIFYKKGFPKDATRPVHLYGYGAYAIAMKPTFSASRLSLLDRGFAYAIAHIRGGTDLGYSWYEAGKLLKKKNTFRDFVACAEYLIAKKYVHPKKLSIEGGSAGGLLVGAVMNMRPDLFHTVVAAVPFVDVVSSLLDDTIPLTTTDAEEFGSPKVQEFYEYMKSYSPYDNTAPAEYPNVYIFSSMNDSQVPYWEPLKWTAKLRAVNRSKSLIALRMNVDAGHGGASGRYDRLKEVAQSYAFVLHSLGISQ